jgi:hypothetical protein
VLDSRAKQESKLPEPSAPPGKIRDASRSTSRVQDLILLYALIALALLSILITRHYGESWDELKFYKYADGALQAYTSWFRAGQITMIGNTYDNYGPAYVMATELGARALGLLIPWSQSDLRHLLYFLFYLVGIWAFYQLAKRWLTASGALGATSLFASQPVLWGHAFISPKDIPFLTLVLLTIHFGFRYFEEEDASPLRGGFKLRQSLLMLTAAWFIFILLSFGGLALIHAWLDGMVRAAAGGQDNIFARLASDIRKVEPEIYIQKYFLLFIRARAFLFIAFTFALILLYRRLAPNVLRNIGRLLLPGALLGLTTGVRILGPLAGIVVVIYAIQKHGRQAWLELVLYASIAAAAMYASWPYLWPDPIGHFIESVQVMAKYPWQGQVLFGGVMYQSTEIPRSYLPVLLGIQLTEPVWVLFLAGFGLAIWTAIRRNSRAIQLLWLTLVWFLLPALGFIVMRSPLYDNFRQVFFILPPVFLLAGVVFDQIAAPKLKAGLILLCLLPGIIGAVRLHPYEYIYYNSLVGGEAGAFRRFETDYWGTSYRAAAGWLNENAAPGSTVWVDGPAHLVDMYLSKDLKLYSSYEAERADHYDYSVSTSRYNLDLTSYPDAPVVYEISRDGAILSVIKRP